ncbi:MFS transporter [Methylophilus sp. Q8]|uniref:MFS transporter n=1 Tax=Methylophilus sp. Q8 TaxID=1506586 RepID=UPI000A77F0CE|nr:MFS transporter [Methylophilus sp. Q8]
MKAGRWWLMVAILLVAVNLRPAMAAFGPLLDLIQHSTGLDATGAGLLTTLPVFLMGLGALLSQSLRQKLGEVNGVTLGVVLIMLACAARGYWGSALAMLTSAAVVGVGVALVQALLPGLIKEHFGAATGRMMGLYTTGIMGGAAVAAASAARLNETLGWQHTLALWALPALLALIVWITASAQRQQPAVIQTQQAPQFWRYSRAWSLMLFFGIGTGVYTLILAWLPPFYVELGQSRQLAGDLLAGLTLTEVMAGMIVSGVVGKYHDRRPLLFTALGCTLAGLAVMIVAPISLAFVAMVLLGLGVGALFPLSLILAMDHWDDPRFSGDLAAFVQGGGYMIASLMPFLAGWVKREFTHLSWAWIGVFVAVFFITLLTARFSPASYRKAFSG